MLPLLCLTLSLSNPVLTEGSLLKEMTDLSALAERPAVHYREAEFTSYDRRSIAPDKPNWFANDDFGQYVRNETHEGRTEHVMADIEGPGVLTRLWTANPSGTLRFYFNGHEEPDITVGMKEFFTNGMGPISPPYLYKASHGYDCYFPIPFSSGCKVTVDDNPPDASRLYYHIGYRLYDRGTSIETFDPHRPSPPPQTASAEPPSRAIVWHLVPGEPQTLDLKGPAEIRSLEFDFSRSPNAVALRHLILDIDFDGEACVRVPLADFFSAVAKVASYQSVAMDVTNDALICRFVMPFRSSAQIRLLDVGSTVRDGITVKAACAPYRFTVRSYHFHCQWMPELGSTRPMRDMHFLAVAGEGRYVGTALAVRNSVTAWWGEGDEKIYVDGEAFPSSFGTGTEDYFGYAWGSNEPFFRPYHGQPYADRPMAYGSSSHYRWHIFDSIPFDRSLKFDLEEWHWAVVDCAYWGTTYWYARPGSTPACPVDVTALELAKLPQIPHVQGAIEGETLPILEKTGGVTEDQDGFEQCSGLAQLWWHDASPGDRLTLEVNAPKDGTYDVQAHFCYAPDYGIQRIVFNGKDLGQIDFYSPKLEWRMVDFGPVPLARGANEFNVTVAGANPSAQPRHMFGLDYLLLRA